MSEKILVTGKKISAMELVTNVTGSEKIPTGQPDDLAITPDQMATYIISRGNLASQEDISQVEVDLIAQIDAVGLEAANQSDSIRALLDAETQARIAADELKVNKAGSVVSVAGRTGDVQLEPSDIGYPELAAMDMRLKEARFIQDASGKNQQEVNDDQEEVNLYGAKTYAMPTGGYPIGALVRLSNGDIVKSKIPNNSNNPNDDMSGWSLPSHDKLSDRDVEGAHPASAIVDESGKDQQTINKLRRFFASVKEFGAVGDGVTDDTDAINNAFNSGAGTVFFPKGTYYITGHITPKGNTFIYGYGATVKSKDYTSNITIDNQDNIVIAGLAVDGNQYNWTSWNGAGISIFESKYITIKDCRLFNVAQAAINIGQKSVDPNERMNQHILVDNCHIHDCGSEAITNYYAYGNGVALVRCTDVVVRNNFIERVYDIGGINLEGLRHDNIIIEGNILKDMTGNCPAIKIYAGGIDDYGDYVIIRDNIIINSGTKDTAEAAIYIRSGGKSITVSGNKIINAYTDAIQVDDAVDIVIEDNSITDCANGSVKINTISDRLVFRDNYIKYPDNVTKDLPIVIETNANGRCSALVTGNTVVDAYGAAFLLNPRTPITFTENTIINARKGISSTGHAITTNFALSNCIIGNNTFISNINGLGGKFIGLYNFSGHTIGLIYKPDIINFVDNVNKFDLTSNCAFIQSDVAIRETPPSVGNHEEGWNCLNKDIDYTPVKGWVCIASGNPGTWIPFGQLQLFGGATAELQSASSAQNTRFKFATAQLLNSTDNKLYISTGNSPTSAWRSVDGISVITPV